MSPRPAAKAKWHFSLGTVIALLTIWRDLKAEVKGTGQSTLTLLKDGYGWMVYTSFALRPLDVVMILVIIGLLTYGIYHWRLHERLSRSAR